MSGGFAELYYASAHRRWRRLRASTSLASTLTAGLTAVSGTGGGGGGGGGGGNLRSAGTFDYFRVGIPLAPLGGQNTANFDYFRVSIPYPGFEV